MSPAVFRASGLRFFFFSREEPRIHVHAIGPEGEAKFWVEPQVVLPKNYGFSDRDIKKAVSLIAEHDRFGRSLQQVAGAAGHIVRSHGVSRRHGGRT